MLSIVGKALIAIIGLLSVMYFVLLELHEAGIRDVRRIAFLRLDEEPGLKRRGRTYKLAILIAVTTVSVLLLIPGWITSEPISYALFVAAECLFARSERAHAALTARFAAAPLWLVHVGILAFATLLGFLALEIPGNERMYMLFTKPLSVVIDLLITACVFIVVWLVFQRRGAALVGVCAVFYLIGVVEYFVASFKEMPLLPSDILALSTAAAVSSNYVYVISGAVLLGFACVVFLGWIVSCSTWGNQGCIWKVPVNLICAVLCGGALVLGFLNISFVDDLGVSIKAWRPLEDYQSNGFITSFLTNVQNIMTQEPDGYSSSNAEELIAAYAAEYDQTTGSSSRRQAATQQYSEQQPNIIVVMNETFADLSIFDGLGIDYEGPEFFLSTDCVMRGTLYVSAYGGGTCNSEFELLTGLSLNYFGQGVYPYTLYNMEGIENLAGYLSGLGYETSAIHPNLATNWNRDLVYSAMGFDNFYVLDDFEDAERIRSFVSDAATYETALNLIDSSDDPQFIFIVTMQNHSGYKTGELDEEVMTDYEPEGMSASKTAELNEYLTLIEMSDNALEDLLEELEASDEPTVVLFFGDHQPYLTTSINNRLFDDEDDLEHIMRLWQTSYMLWANYDIAGADELDSSLDTSTNYLAAMLLDVIGAPLSDYQKANLALQSYIPAINVIGYQGSDGHYYWANPDDSYYSYYQDLEYIQYRRFFDFDRPGGLWIVSREPGVTDPEGELDDTA